MPELSKETLSLLHYIFPGFLAAWVFYGLTSHVKPSNFERVVQALIFTLLTTACVLTIKDIALFIGKYYSFGNWSESLQLPLSVLLAIALGLLVSYITNNDALHDKLRVKGFTTRSSHPSEWHGALSAHAWYVILHFKDEKRLLGYPKIWSADPEKGHFYIEQASWLDEDGTETQLENRQGILVNVTDVKWIEFIQKEAKNEQATNNSTSAIGDRECA